MKSRSIFTLFFATLCAASVALAQGPGGQGGDPSHGGGNQPGGDGPGGDGPGGESGGGGSGGSLTYDSFISITTNANCLVREGTLYGYTDNLGSSLTIGAVVTNIAPGVFAGCDTLTSVSFYSTTGITEIPAHAFAGCTNLTTVRIVSYITRIGEGAFEGCTKLSTISGGSGVSTIGDGAFRGCAALTAIPSTFTALAEIGEYAFAETGLTAIDLNGIAVSEGSFAGCESLATASNIPATLPAAIFSGCPSLATTDVSGVSAFGQAALAGCDALTTLTLDSSATLDDYALAAGEATVATTLDQSALPAYADTSFLGREVSYVPVSEALTRIEAMDLVEWLSDATASAAVTQPADYNTETLATWLTDPDNAYAYAYADDIAADADFIGLTVNGDGFIYSEPSDAALSIGVEVVGCYTLSSDSADWTSDNLEWSDDAGAYVAADATQTSCFARLRFTWDW